MWVNKILTKIHCKNTHKQKEIKNNAIEPTITINENFDHFDEEEPFYHEEEMKQTDKAARH